MHGTFLGTLLPSPFPRYCMWLPGHLLPLSHLWTFLEWSILKHTIGEDILVITLSVPIFVKEYGGGREPKKAPRILWKDKMTENKTP